MNPDFLNKLHTHCAPVPPWRVTRSELERLAYIEDLKTSDGRKVHNLLWSEEYFPEDTRQDANKDESYYEEKNSLEHKKKLNVTQFKNTIALLEKQVKAFKNELEKVYTENGCSEEEIQALLKSLTIASVSST